jgi:hypothetical protein
VWIDNLGRYTVKRAELRVDDEVYYAPGSNYAERDGYKQGRARIVMIAATEAPGSSSRRGVRTYLPVGPERHGYGSCRVLVELVDRDGEQILAALSSLRGPYQQVADRIASERRLRTEHEQAVREREKRTADDTRALAARLRELLDIPVPEFLGDAGNGIFVKRAAWGEIEINRKVARQIIAALEKAAPQPPAAPLPEDQRDVHTEHCCSKHGCKYGKPTCTVESGEKPASFRQECCED